MLQNSIFAAVLQTLEGLAGVDPLAAAQRRELARARAPVGQAQPTPEGFGHRRVAG